MYDLSKVCYDKNIWEKSDGRQTMDCISLLIIGIVIIGVVRSSSRNTKQNESKKMMKNLENAVLENARKRAVEKKLFRRNTKVSKSMNF